MPPANVPNSYHSSQTDTITKSDTHRSSEQTVTTETCRITETTMRMEHKSPLPDIEFNPSPRPFEVKENLDIHTKPYAGNSNHNKYMTDISYAAVPQHQQHTQSPQNHTELDHLMCTTTGTLDQKYKTYEAATQKPPQIEGGPNHLYTNSVVFNEEPMTAKTNCSSVFDKMKQIEKGANDEPAYKPFKIGPIWNAPNEIPIAPNNFDNKQSETAISVTPTYQNGTTTPNPLSETIEQFSSKIHEFEKCHWSNDSDLKAPALVKHVTPIIRPNDAPINEQPEPISVPLNLQPGEPPELCFAPRVSSDRRSSLMEKIEKTLEMDLEKGPTKVLPHSVRMIPPSPPPPPPPSTLTTDHFECSKHIIKQIKPYDINKPNKNINHIKNTFYENTTPPLHRNTFVHVPTPTKAPEKVRLWSVCSCLCVYSFVCLYKLQMFLKQYINRSSSIKLAIIGELIQESSQIP